MKPSKIKSVFFSYSRKDRPIAMRIYDDLIRSGLRVWRDQTSCPYGINFLREIEEKINEYDGFILLDSTNSRKSHWVVDEYRLFRELKKENPTKQLAVCRLESIDQLNTTPSFFDGHDLINHFDFSGIIIYDNDAKYNESIFELCEHWGVSHQPYYINPTEKDFEDEISQFLIEDDDRKALLSDFQTVLLRSRQLFPNVENRIKILLEDCERLEIKVAAPRLELGIIQDASNNISEALQTFDAFVKDFPLDPRGWRGLGAVNIRFKQFKAALIAFNQALFLTKKISGIIPESNIEEKQKWAIYSAENHLKQMDDIRLHIAFCYQKIGRWEDGLFWYETIYDSKISDNTCNPNLFIGLSSCYEKLSRQNQRKATLLEGLTYFPRDCILKRELGRFYFEEGHFDASIDCYEFLIEEEFELMKSYADLMVFLKLTRRRNNFQVRQEEAMSLIPKTKIEHYYYGHILYMKGDKKAATKHYKLSTGNLISYEEFWADLRPYL